MIVETIRDDFGLIPEGVSDRTKSLKRHAGNGYGLATKLARGAVSMPPCAPFVYAVRTAPFQGVEASANLAWSDYFAYVLDNVHIFEGYGVTRVNVIDSTCFGSMATLIQKL